MYTLLRLAAADTDDSGWVLLQNNSDRRPCGKAPLEILATSAAEMEKWELILRLPVGFRVKVKDGAVVHMAMESK